MGLVYPLNIRRLAEPTLLLSDSFVPWNTILIIRYESCEIKKPHFSFLISTNNYICGYVSQN